MQLHCSEKNGKQTTRMVCYCAYHRYVILNYDNIVSPLSLYSVSFTEFSFYKLQKNQKKSLFWNCMGMGVFEFILLLF
jgi:hypothetical protein